MKEMVGGCCVCSDERGWDENPLVYCDGPGCNVAVHQACYGIVTVPSGPWFCRKCESQERSTKVRCELCPCREGALKQTDTGGWAHVVCALYIPEVRFGNVTTMEPILISLIPPERFNKSCYICEETSKGSKPSFGAFMQCNKPGCKQNFHVTCAQMLGLLCEEAGNMMDNVKYCGYCQYHYGKLKKTNNMKIIPPFRPVSSGNSHSGHASSDSRVVKDQLRISPDMNNKMSLKKKLSGSSSTTSNSKSASSHHPSSSSSSSSSPRIAPSNLFSANSVSQSLSKSTIVEKSDGGTNSLQDITSLQGGGGSSKEDSFVLKSEDLKSKNSGGRGNNSANSSTNICDPKKFLDSENTDFMTVKLDDVLTASLNRPIHELPPRDKSQPPDIKPHVTLTPIPLRSSDKQQEKSTILFPGSQSGSANVSTKSKEVHELEKSMADISPAKPASEGAGRASPTKRSSRLNMDFDSTPSVESRAERHSERESRSSADSSSALNWEFLKQQHSSSVTRSSVLEDRGHSSSHHHSSSRNAVDDSREDQVDLDTRLSQTPPKRGPGRPVKRRSGPGREEERLEEPQLRKKSKRGGRRGNSSGYSTRRDDSEPRTLEDSSHYDRKSHHHHRRSSSSHNHSSSSVPHTKDDNPNPTNAPTLSQLKQQQQQQNVEKAELSSPSTSNNNSSTTVPVPVHPTHMFGNTLNPSSSMAQRMVDTLSQEMETMVAAGVGFVDREEKPKEKLVGIPIPKYSSSPLLNGGSSSTPNGGSSSSSSTGTPGSTSSNGSTSNGVATNAPQTLEQLLERQWEQGSQFLMEQAQHLDIAQLLSCLNQLKQDNRTLEEHVSSLIQRKEQLIAINARLSIPLSTTLGTTLTPVDRSLDASAASAPPALRPGSSDPPPPVLPPQPGQGQPAMNGRPINFTGHHVPVVTSLTSPHSNPAGR